MDETRVLAIDDEKGMRDLLTIILQKEGLPADVAGNRADVERLLDEHRYTLVISDIKMSGMSGIDVLRSVRERTPETKVILITAYASTETAIEAMKLGAFEYITKPFDVEEMRRLIRSALQREAAEPIAREIRTQVTTDYIVGDSRGILEICKTIGRIAARKITVVIQGESGTGKELIARAIHYNSDRKARSFISVNCGALTDTLLESELFGHVKGSFTGAIADKKGLFEAAHGGTLFLDEISETSKGFQVKLLRVLQEGTVKRVGDTRDIPVDVRIIAATNRDPERLVREGALREDLYFRLNVISLQIPALRDRPEDIPKLVDYFVRKYRRPDDPTHLTAEAMNLMQRYRWPGNVRELENVVERAMAVAGGESIGPDALPASLSAGDSPEQPESSSVTVVPPGFDLEAHLEEIERGFLRAALERTGGNRQDAAALLGISLRSLRYRLDKLRFESRD
jgi:two-component system response regulator PilR (NtrC family)